MIALNGLTQSSIWMIVAVVVLLIILVFLAYAEMGLSKMTKPKATAIATKGHRAGKPLLRLVNSPERWVNAVLLTVNICQTVQATFTGIVAKQVAGTPGIAVGVVLNVVVFFVIAEAVPKTYAVIDPEKAALRTARPIDALARIPLLGWISKGLIGITNFIVPGKGLDKGPFVSEQELLGIVEAAADDDVIEHGERELIESVIEFGDTIAREVMVPRVDIVMIEITDTVTMALDMAIEHGFSRLPVLGGDDGDDIVGLAFLKDLIKAERDGRGAAAVKEMMRTVRVIPENKPLAHLMREMQAEKFHLAIVGDEYGGIAGLVTLEDCLEELVGEIIDEYDDEEADIQRQDNGDYLVHGGTGVGDLNDLLDIDLPDQDWDTVGGFVFGTLGHVPREGERLDREGWRFTVMQVEGRRVVQVRVSVIEGDDSDDHNDAGFDSL
jgi:putative hemolysin